MVTNQFEMLNMELNRCNWHLLSGEMRQMLVIVMTITQQPTVIWGFGNISCARQCSKNRKIKYLDKDKIII